MATPNDTSVLSKFFTIDTPSSSAAPIKIHTLIYHPQEPKVDNNKAPTIITLHYWGGSASTYHHIPTLLQSQQKQISKTPQSGISTVISISQRGWGESSPATPDIESAYSISALASDMMNLLLQLKSQGLISQAGYILCGHSMGGKVALAVSQLIEESLPHDFPALHGVLLLAPAPPSPLILPDEMREQQVHAYESEGSVEWTVRNVLTGSGGENLYGGDDDLKMIIRDSLGGSEGAKKGWPGFAMAEKVDIRELWKFHQKLRFRVLVSRDDLVETFERVNQETVKCLLGLGYNVHIRVLDSNDKSTNGGSTIGHLLPLEAPREVVEELFELLHDFGVDK